MFGLIYNERICLITLKADRERRIHKIVVLKIM